MLIWPTYPNMGIDNRNQHDLIRSHARRSRGRPPDGRRFSPPGCARPVSDDDVGPGHARRPRRTTGPRRSLVSWRRSEPTASTATRRTASREHSHKPPTRSAILWPLNRKDGPVDEALACNVMTWGQYKFPFVPLVDRYKWLEPRHMVNISDRWNRDKTDDLQFAFFNGVGWESWENVWGIWNGITPRDARGHSAGRNHRTRIRTFPGQSRLGAVVPHAALSESLPAAGRSVIKLVWTIVNRNEYNVQGAQLEVPVQPACATSIFTMASNSSRTPRRQHLSQLSQSKHTAMELFSRPLTANSAPDAHCKLCWRK